MCPISTISRLRGPSMVRCCLAWIRVVMVRLLLYADAGAGGTSIARRRAAGPRPTRQSALAGVEQALSRVALLLARESERVVAPVELTLVGRPKRRSRCRGKQTWIGAGAVLTPGCSRRPHSRRSTSVGRSHRSPGGVAAACSIVDAARTSQLEPRTHGRCDGGPRRRSVSIGGGIRQYGGVRYPVAGIP
jgi:hypothetical protein